MVRKQNKLGLCTQFSANNAKQQAQRVQESFVKKHTGTQVLFALPKPTVVKTVQTK
jgi:hypothetical protein